MSCDTCGAPGESECIDCFEYRVREADRCKQPEEMD